MLRNVAGSITVTVALVGDPSAASATSAYVSRTSGCLGSNGRSERSRSGPRSSYTRSWTARPGEFGVAPYSAFIGFYRPQDETEPTGIDSVLTLVNGEGRVTFNNYFHDTPYGEVLRAAEAGVMGDADPRRMT